MGFTTSCRAAGWALIVMSALFVFTAAEAGAPPPAWRSEVPAGVLESALAVAEGPVYLIEAFPRAGAPRAPGVEVLAEWEGAALVAGPLESIQLLSALGYEVRRIPFPGRPAAKTAPGWVPQVPAAYDARVQGIMDQILQADLIGMLNGLSGETPVTIGGSSVTLDTRYSPAAGCRQAEQYVYETFQAAGLAVEYEPFLGGVLYGLFAAPDGLEGWTCGGAGRVDHTSDGGASWESQSPGTTQDCWSVTSPAPDTLWIAGLGGVIRRSNNGGASWSSQTSGTTVALHGVHFLDTLEGWVVGDAGKILHTTNGGTNWVAQTNPDANRLYSVQFVGPDSGWASGRTGTIVRTTNGGGTWTKMSTPTGERLYDLCFVDRLNGWAVGWNGTILHTIDGGTTWTAQTSPRNVYLYGVDFTSPTEGWIAGWGGTILHTTNAGANWTAVNPGSYADFYCIDFSSPLDGWAAGAGVLIRTVDGGQNWTSQTGLLAGSWRNVIATHPGVTRPGRQILLTAHLDATSGNPTVDAPGADDNGSGSVTVVRAAQIMSSLAFDKTIRFVCFTGEEQGLIGSGAYASNAASRGDTIDAVVNLDMIAYESNNQDVIELHAGTTVPASAAIADVFMDVNTSYGLSLVPEKITSGATTSSDHSSFWDVGYPAILGIEDFQDFTPYYHTVNDRVSTIDQSYFTRFAKASVGTVATLAGPAWTVSVADPAPPVSLLAAGPTPTARGAVFRLALRAPADVRVELFDLGGRRVRAIDGGRRTAGTADIAWDGRDDSGREVPSGIVFYRVTAGGSAFSGRLIVVR
jgi:photosystem II stability/assembly factor-like uncharacterized protein